MAETQIAGRNIGDGTVNHLDLNFSATPVMTPPSSLTAFVVWDSGTSLTKKVNLADLETYFNSKYSLSAHTHTFASLTSKPTTLSGYGITDQIGNRNLILNSPNFLFGSSDQGNANGDIIELDYIKITFPNAGNIYDFVTTSVDRVQGETYTLSFDVNSSAVYGFYFYASESISVINIIPNTLGQWKRFSYTYTQTGVTKTGATSVLFGFQQALAGAVLKYRNLKLEKGSKSTDWTPAPEDQIANWQSTSGYSVIKNKPTTIAGYGITDAVSTSLTYFIGTTSNALNRASGAQTLTGVSIDGNAGSATSAPNYLPLIGGTITGDLSVKNRITIGGTSGTSTAGAGYWTDYILGGKTSLGALTSGNGYGLFYYQGAAGRDGNDSVDIAFNTTTAVTSAMSVKMNGDVKILGITTAASFSGAGTGLTGYASGFRTADRWYDGWVNTPGYDANTIGGSKSGFTYANNAPLNGALINFDVGGYGLQLNSNYGSGVCDVSFRARNGDNGTWGLWGRFLSDSNYNSYSPTLSGVGATGTWGINVNSTLDFGIVNTESGTSAAWRGRTGVKNAAADKATFVGTYGSNSVIGAHNNALTAWADLYVNTVNGTDGGNVKFTGASISSAGLVTAASFMGNSIGISANEGNRIGFWNNDTTYSIAMGLTAAQYQYGPVTDYSIKFNMGGGVGRGFVWGQFGITPIASLNTTSGNMQIAGSMTATGFFASSDMRLKDLVQNIQYAEKIESISYTWKDKSKGTKVQVGYSAQEVQKYMPEAVNEDENGMLSVNYIQVLVAKVQALEKQLKKLQDAN